MLWKKTRPDATDRCDQCHAQAWVIVGAYGTLLSWCAHDWRTHEAKLILVATELHDYRFLMDS